MVFDDKMCINYFRPVDGGARLLWGARADVSPISPTDLPGVLESNMTGVFPALSGVKMEYVRVLPMPHVQKRTRV